MKFSIYKYKWPTDNYYIGTTNLEHGGFLFREDYYHSKEFNYDFLSLLFREYSDVVFDILVSEGKFYNNIEYFEKVLKKIDSYAFISKLTDDIESCYIGKEKLEECLDTGKFDIDTHITSKIIWLKVI